MRRGDFVSIVLSGDYGKPRPALVIQSDVFNLHPSITVLPLTSALRDTPVFRFRVEPSATNGLHVASEIMIDKITTIPREKAGQAFGHLEPKALREVERLLTVWIGICEK